MSGVFRIVKVRKKGFYTYYQVERKYLFLFWSSEGHFDDLESALKFIEDCNVEETREVWNG
ncbi:hypothetical protein PHB09_174 [Pseudomonas phage PHB09]|uniref:Uncharacterized protein n=1 Tax=Pseudomonas phage PHB09 TaxID=2867265 RepID=A0AAE8XCG3_9CAUD|nr:hypothetical protein QGX10_gp173 [Pseudomonas phage PHB09]UAV84669.1 hypothetical protein PHB09_174 [Pseudomonas phage PHB09]